MTAAEPDAAEEQSRERHWRPNLLGASSAMLAFSFGMTMANPLIPAFLHSDFGIQDSGELAFWTGVNGAIAPLLGALGSLLWGSMSDRFGRRNLLIRAVASGGICYLVLSQVQNIGQLLAVRGASGFMTGVQPAALSLVASETPRKHLGRALGALATARSLGQTLGPAVGGIAGTLLPIRAVFALGGLAMFVGIGPILLKVRETNRPAPGRDRPSARAALRSAGRGTRDAIVTIVAAQVLAQLAVVGSQQLMLVRVIQIDPDRAALGSGIAYAGFSVSAAIMALVYTAAVPRFGYRGVAIGSSVLLSLSIVGLAQVSSVVALVACAVVAGAAIGAFAPATASMLGLETPGEIKGTIFGLSSSAQLAGFAVGAISAGLVGAAIGPAGALLAIASAPILATGVLTFKSREPASLGAAPEARVRPD